MSPLLSPLLGLERLDAAPATRQYRAALRALAAVVLQVAPGDGHLSLARAHDERLVLADHRHAGHEVLAGRELLRGNVEQLVALAARQLGHVLDREHE